MPNALQKFIKLEASSGLLLIFTLLIALAIANSPLNSTYQALLDIPFSIKIGDFGLQKPILLWINEGLMAVFFMLLALEIKREVLEGELSNKSQLALPLSAAVGGIVFPALIYLIFNWHDPSAYRGWPIATTTDIAFTLGVIAILGRRVPVSLKVFIVALSIVDDIMAVVIIALFYTADLSMLSLLSALLGVIGLIILNVFKVKRIAPYMLIGIFIWVCVVKSGVHATLAGVIVGLMIPLKPASKSNISPLRHLENILHPWVAYLILPLFVFTNGGVSFTGNGATSLFSSVPMGIAMALLIGKSLGVFLFAALVIKLGIAKLPYQANWQQLFGVSALTGIGFTMSLFLGTLAFYGTPFEDIVKHGVLFGSLCSAILGISFIIIGARKKQPC